MSVKIVGIKKEYFYKWMLTLYLLVNCRFFFLVNLPSIFAGAASNKFLEAIISCILFMVFFLLTKRVKPGKFGLWIVLLYIILLLNTFNSYINYQYNITTLFWPIISFLILLMYFPLKDFLNNPNYCDFFISTSEIITSILCILLLVQRFTYSGGRSYFLALDGMISSRYLVSPALGLRIYSVFDGYVRILILVAAYRSIIRQFKNCFLDIISFLLMLLAIIFVDQSSVLYR